ncbi:NrsF family protein [Hyphomonas sp. NPDC076900]|jgi:hypothetical protein|uniref:NrsF family protein n=1 Tax=unclassified Hyphomonas TaxID=2630699 RepID=UPI000DED8F4C
MSRNSPVARAESPIGTHFLFAGQSHRSTKRPGASPASSAKSQTGTNPPASNPAHSGLPGRAILVSRLVGILVMVLTPLDLRMSAWTSDQFPECLYRIPLLSLPIAMALTLAVRGLGATRLTLAGSAIGAVSGSLAAIVYAGCCPADSILYVVSWYLASVLLCAAAGAVVLSRMLKW